MPRKAQVALITQVTVRFPKLLVDELDAEVSKGRFRDRSELIITAIRDYLDWIREREK